MYHSSSDFRNYTTSEEKYYLSTPIIVVPPVATSKILETDFTCNRGFNRFCLCILLVL